MQSEIGRLEGMSFVELRPTLAVGRRLCFHTINTKISGDKI